MESRSSGASSFGPSSRRSSSCGASRGVVVGGGAPALLLLLLSDGSGARLGLGGGACRGLGSDCRGLGSTFAGVLGVLLLLPMWCYGVLYVDATFSDKSSVLMKIRSERRSERRVVLTIGIISHFQFWVDPVT
jgi:hypothetical protein